MRRKKRNVLTAGCLVCSMLTVLLTGCSMGAAKEPVFEKSEKGIVFTAYAAPTINGNVNEKLDTAYQKLAEAGFNRAVALYEGNSSAEGKDTYDTIRKRSEDAERVALAALELAGKYNVKYFVRDWSFYGLGRNFEDLTEKEQFEKVISEMFSEKNSYIDHPAYGGNFGFDEPSVQEMDTIAWQAEYFNKYIKQNSETGGELFVNLLPGYVADNSEPLSVNKDYTYREYVDYYFEHVAPHLGYVCWDFYPLMSSGSGENYIRDMYYYNLELMAKKCKENDCELRTFVQAKGDFTGTRPLDNIGDLRFQIYSGMAFGVRQFVYYTYSSSVDETDWTADNGYSLYDYKNDGYTWVYDAAKQVNNEVHAMEDAYMAYDWEGTMFMNANEMVDNQLFANLTSPMESHDRMEFVSCTQDVMAGVFRAKEDNNDAKDAFMIVNVTDPSEKLDNEVTVRFEDASALLMYRMGEKKVVPLKGDGSYTFKLQPGEGRFVIPLK